MELTKKLALQQAVEVLILIVMEDTHGVCKNLVSISQVCLNPYCNGRYSWRPTNKLQAHLKF